MHLYFGRKSITTAGRPDKRCYFIGLNLHIDVLQCMKITIIKIHIADIKFAHDSSPLYFLANLPASTFDRALIPITIKSRTTAVANAASV